MTKKIGNFLAAFCCAALFPLALAVAQVAPGPNNLANAPLGKLVTLTAQAAGTVTSVGQNNLYDKGAVCTFVMTAHTGTPSTTFSIQMFDANSNSWQSLVTSGAVVADATPTTIIVYPGIAASGPTGYVGFSGKLTRIWRVSTTVGGTSPVVTAGIGCELLP